MEIPFSAFPSETFLPIHAAIAPNGSPDAEALTLVREAGLILARDLSSGRVFVFYGKEVFAEPPPELEEEEGEADQDPEEVFTIGFDLDWDTDELEWLVGLCEAVKGRCDYRGDPKVKAQPKRFTVGAQ